jgi:hypothetical protein
MRLAQLHGEPKSTLVGPAHARDGTEVPVSRGRRLPAVDQRHAVGSVRSQVMPPRRRYRGHELSGQLVFVLVDEPTTSCSVPLGDFSLSTAFGPKYELAAARTAPGRSPAAGSRP